VKSSNINITKILMGLSIIGLPVIFAIVYLDIKHKLAFYMVIGVVLILFATVISMVILTIKTMLKVKDPVEMKKRFKLFFGILSSSVCLSLILSCFFESYGLTRSILNGLFVSIGIAVFDQYLYKQI